MILSSIDFFASVNKKIRQQINGNISTHNLAQPKVAYSVPSNQD